MSDERFDPVSLEIMWSRMLNVAEEMWSHHPAYRRLDDHRVRKRLRL